MPASAMSMCSQAANPAALANEPSSSARFDLPVERVSTNRVTPTCATAPGASSRADVVASKRRCWPVTAVRVAAVVSAASIRRGACADHSPRLGQPDSVTCHIDRRG